MSLKSNNRVLGLLIIIGLVLISDLKASGWGISADPTVTSIVRQTPADATTDADEVTFRVTFSDEVRRVTPDDFALSGTAAADGTVASVTWVSSSVYDVTITGLDNSRGTVNLDIKGIDATGNNDIAKMPVQLDANSTADIQITDSPVFGQSFRPVNSGLLVDVILKNGVGHNYSGPGTLELISGEGYGGTVLATENIQVTKPQGEKTYTFSNPPLVSAGSTYTLRVNIPGAPSLSTAFSAQVGAGYSGGYLYQASVFSSADLYFKLYIASGSIELLGTSLPSPDESFTISNPPSANNVAISGNLSVGEQLTGTYDFADPLGGSESGSTFKWYRADDVGGSNITEISGAITKIYTITQGDIGSFLSFEVTPSNGTDTGVAVKSTALQVAAPVIIQSVTRHTPSASDIQSSINPVFRVTFNKGVRNVNADDFVVNSSVGGAINTVTPVDERTYDVAVNNLNHASGTLGVRVKGIDGATGTNNITDIAYSNGAVAHQQTTENDYLNQALIGQSFTAISNNYLTAFTLFPRSGTHSFSGTARLRIFQGDASGPAVLNDANAVLFEGSIDVSSSTSASGQTFTVTAPPQLSLGTVYSIVLDNFIGSGTRAFNAHTSGSLANGRAFFTNSNNSGHAAFDFMIDIFEGTQTDGNTLFDSAPGTDESYFVLNNATPTATNVNFTGTLEVGQELSGTYTYADNDNDTESGTTFKWYRSDDNAGTNKAAISGATAQTYTLTSDDIGKFISFEVIPNDGIAAGAPVQSSVRGSVAFSLKLNSITRNSPVDAITANDQVSFLVTFDRKVKTIAISDFNIAGTTAALSFLNYDVNVVSTQKDALTGLQGQLSLLNTQLDAAIVTQNNSRAAILAQFDEQIGIINGLIVDAEELRDNNPEKRAEAEELLVLLNEILGDLERQKEALFATDSESVMSLRSLITSKEQEVAASNIALNNLLQSTFTISISGGNLPGLNGDIFLTIASSHSIVSLDDAALTNIIPVTTNDNTFKILNPIAPVATPPTAPAVTEDGINVALADDIAITDADADADDTQTVTFTITGGALTLGTEGVTFGGEGNGTASYTAAGSLSSINTALDAATFTPTPDLSGTGAATISFKTNDGITDSNIAAVTFDIAAVNDDPTFSTAAVTTVNDNATYTYNFSTNDIDGDVVTVTATTSPGWLTIVGAGDQVSTLAGEGGSAFADGTGSEAQFYNQTDVAIDANGNIYVADALNHRIRKVTPNGVVTTFAGNGSGGSNNGTGTSANFNSPNGVAFDASGNLYVADRDNHLIRKITSAGVVSTLAGTGTFGFVNGNGTLASFNGPSGIAMGSNGILYVSDANNSAIRMISTTGEVTTLAGTGTSGFVNGNGTLASFSSPAGLTVDASGNVYVADTYNHAIRKIAVGGEVTTVAGTGTSGATEGTGTTAQFNTPEGVVLDGAGNIYVGDSGNNNIRKITPGGVTSVLAGNGNFNSIDGNGTAAGFSYPAGLAIDGNSVIYVSDRYGNKIRKIGEGIKLTGEATDQTAGDYNVTLTANDGNGGTVTQVFTVTVVDVTNPVLTSGITTNDFAENGTGTVYTVTGTDTNQSGVTYSLGSGNDEALFDIVSSTGVITFKTVPDFESPSDQGGDNMYVINVIAKDAATNSANQDVTFSVTNVSDVDPMFTSTAVTTVNDNATYTYDIATSDADGDEVMVMATTAPGWLSLKQSQKGVTTFAGTGLNKQGSNGPGTGVSTDGTLDAASFSWPTDIVIDDQENIYVLDRFEGKLRKIATDGNVTTIAGSEFGTQLGTGTNAKLKYPEVMALGNNNIMYVPSGFSRDSEDFIRKIDVTTGAVTAFVGGLKGVSGLAYDKATDILYASHSGFNGESEILMFDSQGKKTVLAGNGSGFVNGTGTDAKFYFPRDLLLDGTGNLYVSDQGNNSIRKIELATKVVTTVAGGSSGTNDGTGTDAQFNGPYGLAMDAQSNLYVADRFNYAIRKIDPNGVVTTVSGIKGENGDLDGSLESAKFYDPDGLAIDSEGNFLVADQYTSKIRKISLTTSLALSGDATGQAAGDYPVTLTANDGNGGTATQTFNVTVVDVTAPDKPVITHISDDTGVSSSDGITSDKNIFIMGTAEANSNIELFTQYGSVGTTQVDGQGNWTYDLTGTTLVELTFNTTAKATDAAGNRSEASNVFTIKADFTVPVAPVITHISDDTGVSSSDGITSDKNILISGTAEANSSVELLTQFGSVGITQADGNGDWTYDMTGTALLESFTFNLTAKATDTAGNTSEASNVFSLRGDFTAPAKPVITGITEDTGVSSSDGITSDKNILISGTAEANSSIELLTQFGSVGTTQVDGNGDWTYDMTGTTLLESFTFNLTAKATDVAGNTGEASNVFSLKGDFTAPSAPVITHISDDTGVSSSDGITSDKNILISGTAEANSSIELLTQFGSVGTTQVDGNGDWTYDMTGTTLLESFTFNLTAKATDVAGNTSEASNVFSLKGDFTAPSAPVITHISDDTGVSSSDGITSDKNILISGTAEANSSIELLTQFGSVGITPVDGNGDWTYDMTGTTLLESFTFNLTAKATDTAGNTSEAGNVFSLRGDFTAPAKPVITHISDDTGVSNSDGITSDKNILIMGTAEANSSVELFTQYGSVGTTQADGNGDWTYDLTGTTLVELTFNTTAKATDAAGNRSELSNVFTIKADFTGPNVMLKSSGTTTNGDLKVTVEFSEDVVGFSLNDITAAAGSVSNLVGVDGKTYTFEVTNASTNVSVAANLVEDLAGNGNLASNDLSLDFTLPSTTSNFDVTSSELENTSAEFVNADQIRLYPNPASNILNIDMSVFKGQPADVRIYSASGVGQYDKKGLTDSSLRIDVSNYSQGIFVVLIKSGDSFIRKKFVIQR